MILAPPDGKLQDQVALYKRDTTRLEFQNNELEKQILDLEKGETRCVCVCGVRRETKCVCVCVCVCVWCDGRPGVCGVYVSLYSMCVQYSTVCTQSVSYLYSTGYACTVYNLDIIMCLYIHYLPCTVVVK